MSPCSCSLRLRRERELLSEYAHAWFRGSFPGIGEPSEALVAQWWTWLRKGHVAHIECSLQTWRDHGEAIVAASPVEELRLLHRVGEHVDTPWCLRSSSWTVGMNCQCAVGALALDWARSLHGWEAVTGTRIP